MKIPDFVRHILDAYDADIKPLMEAQVHDALSGARKAQGDLSDEDFRGFKAEASAFFFHERRDEDSVWGTYFAPTFTATAQDGSEIRIPNIAEFDADTVAHWERRAGEAKHPVLRARYADLVWDLKRAIAGERPDIKFAHIAIDAYVEAARKTLYGMGIEGIHWLERALDLSLKTNDKARQKSVVDSMFEFYGRVATPQHIGCWIFLFDDLYGRNDLITAEQESTIIERLERMLAAVSDNDDPGNFNPFGAEAASERLARHYQRQRNTTEVRRVVKTYGHTFESASEDAASFLAMAWLQPVYEKYKEVGMDADAERVQLASLEKSKGLEKDMKTFSIQVEIKREDIDRMVGDLTGGDLTSSLVRLAVMFIPDVANAKAFLKRLQVDAPLQSLIGVVHVADGQIVARTGSVDEDEEGRVYIQLAENISFAQPFLATAIDGLREKYAPRAADFIAFLNESPVFQNAREDLLRDGIDAYLGGDYVKAVHVLVPQFEHQLRVLLALLGVPINKPVRGVAGIMQMKNVNDVLQETRVRNALGENLWKYLDVFLADHRGPNLRNRLAHGLIDTAELSRPLADRLLHCFLCLALVRKKQEQDGSGQNPK